MLHKRDHMLLLNKLKITKLFQSISFVTLFCVFIFLIFGQKKEKFAEENTTTTPPTTTPETSSTTVLPFTVITKEDFTSQVNLSDFFSFLSDEDLTARSVGRDIVYQGGEQYRNEYIAGYEDMSEDDKALLSKVVEAANKVLIPYSNLQRLDWRIAKVSTKFENGLPHTIGNMIIINSDVLKKSEKELIKTLIHEKLHVFQRMNTGLVRQWMGKVGFRALLPNEYASMSKDLLQLRRSNPDLDKNTYVHIPSNLVIKQVYNSSAPTSLLDSKALGLSLQSQYKPIALTNDLLGLPKSLYCQLEHPNEIMACLISEMITDTTWAKSNEDNVYVSKTQEWMLKTL